jgi:hypothetical protein
LSSVTFEAPSHLTSIPDGLFKYCHALQTLHHARVCDENCPFRICFVGCQFCH